MAPTPGMQVAPPAPAADEVWAPIPRHPGYEASTHGRIRSVDRTRTTKNGATRYYTGQVLKPSPGGSKGHLYVVLEGKRHRYVHSLVLEAHVGPAPEGMECCHGNGQNTDNTLSNLRWGTAEENADDAIRHGTHPKARTHCPRNHLLANPNLVPASLREGRRSCLACKRARDRAWTMTQKCAEVEVDLQSLSDAYYAELMSKHLRENQAA